MYPYTAGCHLLAVEFLMNDPNSKVHDANMGPIWGRQDPDGPHIGPMNFAISGSFAPSLPDSRMRQTRAFSAVVNYKIFWQRDPFIYFIKYNCNSLKKVMYSKCENHNKTLQALPPLILSNFVHWMFRTDRFQMHLSGRVPQHSINHGIAINPVRHWYINHILSQGLTIK